MTQATESGQDKSAEQGFYDRLFSERKRFDQFPPTLYKNVARDARAATEGKRALDLGCGSGTQAGCLVAEGFDVLAMDLSVEAVKLTRATVREAGGEAQVVNADAEHLPLRDASIDAAVCSLLWHHFARLDLLAAELQRVVRPGGVVLATDANAHNPFQFLFMNVVHPIRPFSGVTPNQRAIGRKEIETTFGARGFEDFEFSSYTTELKRDWLDKSLGATLNYYTRATVLGLSRVLLPQIAQGNTLYSRMRRSAA